MLQFLASGVTPMRTTQVSNLALQCTARDIKISIEGVYHPDFCNGALWITTPSVGLTLSEAARHIPDHFHAEDIYLAGIKGLSRQHFDITMSRHDS